MSSDPFDMNSLADYLSQDEISTLSQLSNTQPELVSIIQKFQTKLKTADYQLETIDALQSELNNAQHILSNNQQELEQARSIATILEPILPHAQNLNKNQYVLSEFERIVHSLVDQQSRTSTKVFSQTMLNYELEEQLNQEKQTNRKHLEQLKILTDQSTQLEVDVKNKDFSIINLTRENELLNKQLAESVNYSKSIEDQLSQLLHLNPSKIHGLKCTISGLESQVMTNELSLTSLIEQLKVRTQEVNQLKDDLLQRDIRLKTDEILLSTQIEDLQTRLNHSEYLHNHQKKNNDELLHKIVDLEQEVNNINDEKASLEAEYNQFKSEYDELSHQYNELIKNTSNLVDISQRNEGQDPSESSELTEESKSYLALAQAYNNLRTENEHLSSMVRDMVSEIQSKSKLFNKQTDEYFSLGKAFTQNASLITETVLERDSLKNSLKSVEEENTQLKQNESKLKHLNYQLSRQVQTLLQQIHLEDQRFESQVEINPEVDELYKQFEYQDIETLLNKNFQLNELVFVLNEQIKKLEQQSGFMVGLSESETIQKLQTDIQHLKNSESLQSQLMIKYNEERTSLANILSGFLIIFKHQLSDNKELEGLGNFIVDVKNYVSNFNSLKEQIDTFLDKFYTDQQNIESTNVRLTNERDQLKINLIESEQLTKHLDSKYKSIDDQIWNYIDLTSRQQETIQNLNNKVHILTKQLTELEHPPSIQTETELKKLKQDFQILCEQKLMYEARSADLDNALNLTNFNQTQLEAQIKFLELTNETTQAGLAHSKYPEFVKDLLDDKSQLQKKLNELTKDHHLLNLRLKNEIWKGVERSQQLTNSFKATYDELKQLRDNLTRHKSNNVALSCQVDELSAKINELLSAQPLPTFDQQQLQNVQHELDRANATIFQLEIQLIDAKDFEDTLNVQIDQLKVEYAQLLDKFDTSSFQLRSRINDLGQREATLRHSFDSKEDELRRVQAEKLAIQNQLDQLNNNRIEAETKLTLEIQELKSKDQQNSERIKAIAEENDLMLNRYCTLMQDYSQLSLMLRDKLNSHLTASPAIPPPMDQESVTQ